MTVRVVLRGGMSIQARNDSLTAFNNDPDMRIILISLKAGGEGLNLQVANYVFLLDPWWNPAAEDQATDRAHRIGRTRRCRTGEKTSEKTGRQHRRDPDMTRQRLRQGAGSRLVKEFEIPQS